MQRRTTDPSNRNRRENRTVPYDATDLHRFRQVQRLAYDLTQKVESQLQPGMSESEVATLMVAAQAQHHVFQVFHEPFAWFGVRTMLGPDWTGGLTATPDGSSTDGHSTQPTANAELARASNRFFPSHESLADGMPVILDLAPAVDGIASDVGYSFTFTATKAATATEATRAGRSAKPPPSNRLFDELDAGLARIRTFLLEGVRQGETLLSLYRLLDELLDDRGWLNCHQHYPARALGHLVFPLGPDPERATPIPGFGTAAAEGLLAAGVQALKDESVYPVWNDSAFTDYPASPGLWAVEPHIGCDGVGVKFEELLVVTENDAYWLDDALPHVQRWTAARYSTESFRRG
jgi:Metallopeptidase family M24